MRSLKWLISVFAVSLLSGCGYNTILAQDEAVTAAWS